MSFWNFIGEFALFNTIWNMFSGKPKHSAQPVHPIHTYTPDADYQSRIEELNQEIRDSKKRIAEYQRIIDDNRYTDPDFNDIDEIDDIDDLQDRIDELEDQLADCDITSERYDRLQDRIDTLQDRLDELEDKQDQYDDLKDYRDSDDWDDTLTMRSDDWDDDL